MIDLKLVAEGYDKMTDAELVAFAKNDATQLTEEAFALLMDQFKKRQIDWNVLEMGDVSKHIEFTRKDERKEHKKYTQEALNAKENGYVDEDIVWILVSKGVTESSAKNIVQQLQHTARRLYNESTSYITLAWVCFFSAIILIIFISTKSLPVTSGMFALCLFFVCIINGLKGYQQKKKYQTILTNIDHHTKINHLQNFENSVENNE